MDIKCPLCVQFGGYVEKYYLPYKANETAFIFL